jgi:hypothetical protein
LSRKTLHGISTRPSRSTAPATIHKKIKGARNEPGTVVFGSGLPNGLTISSIGVITGTIAPGDRNAQVFYPTVTDGIDTNTTVLTWNVANPVTIAGLATQQSTEGATITLTPTSSSLSLTCTAQGLPSGLSIQCVYRRDFRSHRLGCGQ